MFITMEKTVNDYIASELYKNHKIDDEFLISFYLSYDNDKWRYYLEYVYFDYIEYKYIFLNDFDEGQKFIKDLKIIPFIDLRRLLQ